MNPFDLKTVLLARHAQHVVLVHFPIALFLTGAGCDLLARWRPRRLLFDVARFNLWAAAIAALPVLATGILAWQLQFHGRRLQGLLLFHPALGVLTCALLWVVASTMSTEDQQSSAFRRGLHVAAELAGMAAIVITAHLGGFLSGVNVPG